jgi:hypothetical protein
MTIKASGRVALTLILATGLFVWFAGPSQAATDEDDGVASAEMPAGPPIALNRYANPGLRHRRARVHARSTKAASKSSVSTKTSEAAVDNAPKISHSVANANAQLKSTETPAANGETMSVRASDVRQAATDNSMDAPPPAKSQTVSVDQLTDVDRALQESKSIAATFAMASAGTQATTRSDASSTWERTSSIGKIFIGVGVLLTMASAARMFMA